MLTISQLLKNSIKCTEQNLVHFSAYWYSKSWNIAIPHDRRSCQIYLIAILICIWDCNRTLQNCWNNCNNNLIIHTLLTQLFLAHITFDHKEYLWYISIGIFWMYEESSSITVLIYVLLICEHFTYVNIIFVSEILNMR